MLEIFKSKFPFAYGYFDFLFKNGKSFPQSIVFEGLDIYGQYFFSLELARILNCKMGGSDNCQCINCSWIRENKHPEVITVSPIDFKPPGDESKTVISVKQTREIIKTLSHKSEYHRVFIFLDSKEGKLDEDSREKLEFYKKTGFSLVGENRIIEGLKGKIFDDEAPNSLLKSIEEPPPNTTFIFLTKNREDLIETIVSRSFVFKMAGEKISFDYSGIERIISEYPNLSLSDSLRISDEIYNYMTEHDILPSDILNMIEEFLGEYLKENPNNSKIKKDLLKTNEGKRMLEASIRPKSVFDYLFIEFSL